MKYYVFSVSEDGDVSITEHTKEELEREITKNNWPDPEACRDNVDGDLMQWGERNGGNYVIFKGEIVQPEAVEVTVEHRLP